jgi:plasmid maintenance system antidote protein VapI
MPTVRKEIKMEREDEWMTLQAAADALGVTRTTALALIVKGDLVGQHIAKRTVVRRDTVNALVAARAAVVA